MKIHDISVSLSNQMPVYPGDPPLRIVREHSVPEAEFNVSDVVTGTHIGTHIDPPFHFIESGYTVDQIPLDHLYGEAEVVDLTLVKTQVTSSDLNGISSDIILLKTRNSKLWESSEFSKDYVSLDESAARWAVENHIKTIGIDYLSIGSFDDGAGVHRILLGGGVTVVEGLDLRGITPGIYTLACLPIKIKDGDGAPARAILIEK
jgi:arylformamidase